MTMEFFREPTEEEKRDFRPIPVVVQKKNAIDLFREKLEQTEKTYLSRYKPFCARCARIDFKDEVDNKVKEFERSTGYVDFSKFKIRMPNLDKYGDPKRFDLVRETDAMEPISKADFQKGEVQRLIKIGVHREYKCKERGCGLSIFVPNNVLEKEKEREKEQKNKSSNPKKK